MNWTDYIIIVVLGVSVLIGLWRGLISEVLALAIWIAAFWVAWAFGPTLAAHLPAAVRLPSARILIGYGVCFIVVLIAGALVRFLVSRLVESTGLTGTDRLLGMVFGFVRGVLLVTLAVFMLGFTAFTRDPWWRDSVLLPQFQGMAVWLGQQIPASAQRYLNPNTVIDHLPALPARPHEAQPGATPAHSASSHVPASAATL